MQDLVINGRFLSQRTTGVQRVGREVTRAIDSLIRSGEYRGRVVLIGREMAELESLELTSIELSTARGPPGHLWEQSVLPKIVGDRRLLCLGNTAPVACLLRSKRTAVMIHDLTYKAYPNAYSRLYWLVHSGMLPLLLRYADPIITVSETEREVITRLSPATAARIVVAQNGGWRDDVPTRKFIETCPSERRYLLYVGSFSPRKNFARVLEIAIRLARERGLKTRLVGSVGRVLRSPPLEIPSDVAAHIELVGQVENDEELAKIYAGACCLLFPSLYEASPLPPLEAMRFACPVVASDLPAIRERCGSAVAYCDPKSTENIIEALTRVLSDDAYARSLVYRGKVRSEMYSWRNQARTILESMSAPAC